MGGRAINSKVISEVLLRLYESRADGDFYEHVLELLEDNIPYVVSGYAFTYPADQRFDERLVRNGNRVSRPSVPDLDRLVGMHPFFPVYLNNNMGPVICTTDLMSAEEWKRTEIYNELHRKYGVVHDTSIRFYDQHKCISFCFSDQRPMDAEHRRLLNLVAPHLATAYRSFRLQQNGLAELLPAHMVLLNSAGRPQILSPAAEDCFGRYLPRGKRCSGGRLPAELEEWVQHELSAAARGSAPEPMVIRNRNGAVVFRLTRFADGWVLSMDDMAPPRSVDVFVGMGLTHREAEVLVWVVQGKQNEDIGCILEISKQTVRKHVENILGKLCCETRGAAAMLAMSTLTERTYGVSFDLSF